MSHPVPALHDTVDEREGVTWIKLAAEEWVAGSARRFVAALLTDSDAVAGVVDTARLVVSELATNALSAAVAFSAERGFVWERHATPIHIGVQARAGWARLLVRDPDPAVPRPDVRPELDEHGRGLTIATAQTSALWYASLGFYKVANAVIAAPGSVLTDTDLAAMW